MTPLVLFVVALATQGSPPGFDHARHARVFPSCLSCHAGAVRAGAPLWPTAAGCAACHDGTVQPAVTWTPPQPQRVSNLRFEHVRHVAVSAARGAAATTCATCHTAVGQPRMAVRATVVERCMDCHSPRTAHLAVADAACATCHVPLARAQGLSRAAVARFPSPPSHRLPLFGGREHGRLATAADASCATCHARNFCAQCHAGATPPRAVTALALDARSLAIAVNRVPASHRDNFADRHAAEAAASGATCSACHVRADCLACHRPAPGAGSGYHAPGFLVRHPAAAYGRQTNCADCHNVTAFCATCHVRAGITSRGPLRGGYHDAKQFFLVGHGNAARQGLETCVTCHAERDCASCHAAGGGRNFNPHGRDFDAARLKRKNPEVCTACHGAAIPGG